MGLGAPKFVPIWRYPGGSLGLQDADEERLMLFRVIGMSNALLKMHTNAHERKQNHETHTICIPANAGIGRL